MAAVKLFLSISLDGFVAGPNQSEENPLGEGGMRLHDWAFELAAWREPHGQEGGEVNASTEIVEEMREGVGATLMGRNMFGGGPGPWGEDPWQGWWGEEPAAGDKDVAIGGGASAARQYIGAGLVDEINLAFVPILLGSGARLFDQGAGAGTALEVARVVDAPGVTHLKYR